MSTKSLFFRKRVLIPAFCLLAALGITTYFTQALQPRLDTTSTGPLPVLEGAELKSKIGEIPSQIVLLNLWATWCAPCKEELPSLKALQTHYGEKDLAVILLTMDVPDDLPLAHQMAENIGLLNPEGHPFVVAKSSEDMEFFQKLGLAAPQGIPATYLFRPDGKVIAKWFGIRSFEEMKLEIERHLE